jgi:antitoxin (DNA-binding transcriptional repressor) of toxin-antitoxin stability system
MKQLTVEQAIQSLPELVTAAIDGEDVVVQHQRGAVRLVPIETRQRRPVFGSAKGLISMADDFDAPLEDFRDYLE